MTGPHRKTPAMLVKTSEPQAPKLLLSAPPFKAYGLLTSGSAPPTPPQNGWPRPYIKNAARAAAFATHLTQHMLDLARGSEPDADAFNLNACIRENDVLLHMLMPRHAALTFDLCPQDPLVVVNRRAQSCPPCSRDAGSGTRPCRCPNPPQPTPDADRPRERPFASGRRSASGDGQRRGNRPSHDNQRLQTVLPSKNHRQGHGTQTPPANVCRQPQWHHRRQPARPEHNLYAYITFLRNAQPVLWPLNRYPAPRQLAVHRNQLSA